MKIRQVLKNFKAFEVSWVFYSLQRLTRENSNLKLRIARLNDILEQQEEEQSKSDAANPKIQQLENEKKLFEAKMNKFKREIIELSGRVEELKSKVDEMNDWKKKERIFIGVLVLAIVLMWKKT